MKALEISLSRATWSKDLSEVKRQHYVPQFLLKRFADNDGKLSVFVRTRGLSHRASPKDVACQRYYNAAKLESGEIDTQTIEKELSLIEGAGSAAINTLLSGERPTVEQRKDFALLLASQDFRSPRRRQQFADMLLGIQHNRFGRDTIESVANFIRDVTQASETVSQLDVTKISRSSELKVDEDGAISVSVEDTIRALTAAKHFSPAVAKMDWHLFRAPQGESFIISDSPVQLHESRGTLESFSGPAYWRKGTRIYFPLSSEACFMASHRIEIDVVALPPKFIVKEAKASEVRFFNQLQITGCLKQVYATSNYSWLIKKCAELPELTSDLSFMPVNAEGKRISVTTKR
ncbi:DUF4238 domain-containing protein [Cereibacter johrii]|uniref:DUF4238 domain-containing protein n=1 Tax=Cereibacter johrii TaxID=445629 RepID=UPI00167EEACB|nr:DUF4238 domain-containing protein [Cereibacter johrii]